MAEQLQLSITDPRRLHPKWGYDLDRVKDVKCLLCGQRIGNEEYVEDTAWARFGQMFFIHKRCDEASKKQKEAGNQ